MKAVLLGVIEDLRAKRLWPVALLMIVALVALPLVMLEPAAPTSAPADPAGSTAEAPAGLPSPEQALTGEGDAKALVTLAVLQRPSSLDSFDSRNPFRPLQPLDGSEATDEALADVGGSDVDSTLASLDGDSGGGSSVPDAGDPSGGAPGGPPLPELPDSDPDTAPQPAPEPIPEPQPVPEPETLTYALDVSFTNPEGVERSYRSLPRLSMLPSSASPLLIYLGVDETGTKAVFLVDAKLRAENGEGSCRPNPAECATLEIEPGEQQTFVDQLDRRYKILIDQIRLVSVEAAAERRERLRAQASEREPRDVVRRFVAPLIVDLLTGVQR